MNAKTEQLLVKTPQGVNATRSGVGLSLKAHTMLKLFDGTMPVDAFKTVCQGASMSEADFDSTLKELLQFEHLRLAEDAAGGAPSKPAGEGERRMLLTLDFTVGGEVPSRVPSRPATPAGRAPASTGTAAAAAAAAAQARAPAMPMAAVVAGEAAAAIITDDAEDKTARLKRETEVRQKLITSLQPRIEEELRARLRPRLEQELRPKLIAALRPGIEAEVRSALVKELTPRVELELKARFAKTLAAQKAADAQVAAVAEPVAAPAPAADSAQERMMASISAPLFTLDKTGVCNYMSPAWAQFSGHAVSDVVGKHLVDFFVDGDRRAITAMLTGIANGTALRFEQSGALSRKDEAPLWVEVSAAPLTAADGKSIGVCGVLRDAAQLRHAMEQAEADGVRLLLLVDQIDTGVVLEDAEGNIQQANPALCTLLSLEAAPYSLEGMPLSELFDLSAKSFIGPDGFLRRMSELRAAGEDAKGESFVMADGRVVALDYLAVTVGSDTVGHLWLFREMQRPPARSAS